MTQEEKNVEMWRIKKLIKTLENAKGYHHIYLRPYV